MSTQGNSSPAWDGTSSLPEWARCAASRYLILKLDAEQSANAAEDSIMSHQTQSPVPDRSAARTLMQEVIARNEEFMLRLKNCAKRQGVHGTQQSELTEARNSANAGTTSTPPGSWHLFDSEDSETRWRTGHNETSKLGESPVSDASPEGADVHGISWSVRAEPPISASPAPIPDNSPSSQPPRHPRQSQSQERDQHPSLTPNLSSAQSRHSKFSPTIGIRTSTTLVCDYDRARARSSSPPPSRHDDGLPSLRSQQARSMTPPPSQTTQAYTSFPTARSSTSITAMSRALFEPSRIWPGGAKSLSPVEMQDPTLRTVSPPTGSPPQQGHRPCPWDKSNLKALATGAGSNQHAPTLAKPLHQPSSDHDATAGFPIAAAMSAGAQHAASAVRGPVATARRNRSRSGSPTSMVAAWLGELGLGHLEQEFASEGVDEEALSAMTAEEFRAVGVERVGDQAKLRARAARVMEDSGGGRSVHVTPSLHVSPDAPHVSGSVHMTAGDAHGSRELAAGPPRRLSPEQPRAAGLTRRAC